MKIIECPRDAMQGIDTFIPTPTKVRYINQLLKVGFDTIDVGSFVSPKAIPQLRDTADVLHQIDAIGNTKLLVIVANTRGAKEAVAFDTVTYLGFPLSMSETFQQRNTNRSIAEALETLKEIKDLCVKHDKKLVTYISMGFGNPYGDPYDAAMVSEFVDKLVALGSDVTSLADTVGVATPSEIRHLFSALSKGYPSLEIGAHLHASPTKAWEKIDAAFSAGCKRFDGAIKGYGGCPMANDDLVGNLATETILTYLNQHGTATGLRPTAFAEALRMADEIFPNH